MIIQIVRFESALAESQVVSKAQERIDEFRAMPGLIQKYYVKLDQPNSYGGIYLWDSVESLAAYRDSDLASSIPAAYQVIGKPTIEIVDVLFPLRE